MDVFVKIHDMVMLTPGRSVLECPSQNSDLSSTIYHVDLHVLHRLTTIYPSPSPSLQLTRPVSCIDMYHCVILFQSLICEVIRFVEYKPKA